MATTAYTITTIAADETREVALEGKTFNKKATAVAKATELRDELKVAVEVTTQTGTVVFEQAAPKKIKMSPQYTRVQELPEGVVAPEGKRVAYVRPRAGLAVLHDAEAEKGTQYSILNLKTGKELKTRFATTRAAGARMTEIAKPKDGGEAPKPTPAPAPETTPEAPVADPSELASA